MPINLAQKDEYSTLPANPSDSPRMSYPMLNITTDKKLDLPSGDFMAEVTLHMKGMESSENEKGKIRYTYRFEVMDIEPGEETAEEEASEGEGESAETDDKPEEEMGAAEAIMASMGRARVKKMTS